MKDIELVDVESVEPLDGYRVRLVFSDSFERDVDLEPYLKGPIFEAVREPHFFRMVRVDPETGTIAWPNGADIDPIVLRYGLTPALWEDESFHSKSSPSGADLKPREQRSGAKFVLRRVSSGEYYFTFVASNGEELVTSETYVSKEDALRAINSLRRVGSDAEVVEHA